jgi:hypothetical protein
LTKDGRLKYEVAKQKIMQEKLKKAEEYYSGR